MAKQKDYYTIEEAARELAWDRSTVYARMKRLGMTRTKFAGDRRVFLTRYDLEQLMTYKYEPWKVAKKESAPDEQQHAALTRA